MSVKEKIIMGMLMSLCMALALSCYFTLTRLGFQQGWHLIWMKTFVSAWPVAFVTSSLLAKPVSVLAHKMAARF